MANRIPKIGQRWKRKKANSHVIITKISLVEKDDDDTEVFYVEFEGKGWEDDGCGCGSSFLNNFSLTKQ